MMKSQLLLVVLGLSAFAASACSTVVVGRKASTTGYVIVGHAEDDGGNLRFAHAIVPARDWPAGSRIPEVPGRASTPQVPHTCRFWWSEVREPELGVSCADAFYNEHGVWVVSNFGGMTRPGDDLRPDDLTDGGVGYTVRRAVAERATSARHAVDIIADVIARWGYIDASRVYTIADRDEAWSVQILRGRRFAACRCPDDGVLFVPNHLTIRALPERPTADAVYSADLWSWAEKRGWWKPGAPRDFARVFLADRWREIPHNTVRRRYVLSLLLGREPTEADCGFSVRCPKPLSPEDIARVMTAHPEGVPHHEKDSAGPSVCRGSTVETTVCAFGARPEETCLHLGSPPACVRGFKVFRPLADAAAAGFDDGDGARRLDEHFVDCSDPAPLGRLSADGRFAFSRAGYWDAPGSPRRVSNFNLGWEFSLDDFKTARPVALPHGLDEGELPMQASGCVNRQQGAWYRKRFVWHRTSAKSFLHFEAIMGKSRVTVNGRVAAEHFGGYLPIHVDVTDLLRDGENEVVVWCDNSDDPSYPPGKPQRDLDFTYFGGIYRDAYLIETGSAYVTDSDRGGVFVRTRPLADGKWEVAVEASVVKDEGDAVRFRYDGLPVVPPFVLDRPKLWTPDEPNLHDLDVEVLHGGCASDAVRVRFGVREVRLTGQGLFINGRKGRKLIGVNRHQDYQYLGNALANSLHWRDAKKYRDAGFTAIRNAHYPQDPAFMDACDAFGLLVIVNTPGWQFWNDGDPRFAARVYDDIAKMCRRDRSRACLLMWEPILNETRFPADFSARARAIVKAETRGTDGVCACDPQSAGSDAYDVVYTSCSVTNAVGTARPTFIREWGDFVDDWSAQNSPSRAAREWGEQAMLAQAEHYRMGHGGWASLKSILASPDSMLGGCLWHGADHARGYHPDNFFGGVLSYDRRRKYAWHMFKAELTTEPYIYVANALTPLSPPAVTIYSNCAYTASWYGKPFTGGMRQSEDDRRAHEDAYFYEHKLPLEFVSLAVTRADGVKEVKPWARRFSGVVLSLDTEGLEPVADGSDEVTVVATLVDEHGNAKPYQNEEVVFSVDGPGELIGPCRQTTRFGEATVVLRLQAREKPEEIRLTCELARRGRHVPRGAAYAFTPGRKNGKSVPLAEVTDESSDVGKDQNAFRVK